MNKTTFAFLLVLTPFSALAGTTIQENVNGTVPYVNAGKSADGATSSTALGLQVNGTEMMRVTASGNVGIGTTNAPNKLTIGGTAGTDGIQFPDGTIQKSASLNGVTHVESTSTAFPADGAPASFAHGLGTAPTRFGAYAVCTVPLDGFAVGDRFNLTSTDGDGTRQAAVWANSTLVAYRNVAGIVAGSPNGGRIWMTSANFNIVLWAEK